MFSVAFCLVICCVVSKLLQTALIVKSRIFFHVQLIDIFYIRHTVDIDATLLFFDL